MLKVILLENAKDLYPLEFLLNPDIPTNLVVPSPSLADDLRERFLDKEVDLITISKFVENELDEKKEDKAHLIFDLIRCYKKNFADPSFEKFLHCFNHFTDLRSFTLEYSLIEEVLPEFDEEVALGLSLFWKEVTDNSLLDEHSSYYKLSEKFKDLETTPLKNIIFYGFGHLSAIQVEMIQSLSKHYNIYIPFLKRVFLKSHSSDWIKWIDTSFDYKEEVPLPPKSKGKVAFYPQNKMSEFLSVCPIFPKNEKVDFYILSKNLDFNLVNEIPISGVNFKVKNDLFSQKLKTFFETFKGVDAQSEIENHLNEELKKDFDKKDFRLLKILYLIKENLKYFGKKLDRFDLSALEYVVSLELPRTYSTPILSKEAIGEIRGRGSLISYEPKNLNIILSPSEDSSIKVGGAKYPKKVEEFLNALGPIQNQYLDFLNTLEILREIFQDPRTLLVTEFGSEKTDESIEQIISKLKIEKLEVDFGSDYKEIKDHLDKYIVKASEIQKTLSASKLQTYVDCPRKFYFSYLKKIGSEPPKADFSPLQLGSIEHAVIGSYLEKNGDFKHEIFEKTAMEELDKYIIENNMNPPSLEKERALIEIKDYSRNGILELLKLKSIFPNCGFGFEKPLIKSAGLPINGRLDVIVSTTEGYAVLDFKRSKGSIGNAKQLMEFEKIQPWFYLNHYPVENQNCLFLGYINLSDPKESLIHCSDDLIVEKLKSVGFLEGENIRTSKHETISSKLEQFSDFEKETFKEMNNEKEFLAGPINPKVCDYCSVNQVCPKEGDVHAIT